MTYTLLDRPQNGCCYIVNTKSPAMYCGATVEKYRPDGMWNYCDNHRSAMRDTGHKHHPRSVHSAGFAATVRPKPLYPKLTSKPVTISKSELQPHMGTSGIWADPKNVETLMVMKRNGYTQRQIAATLGTTVGAVAGKIDRIQYRNKLIANTP